MAASVVSRNGALGNNEQLLPHQRGVAATAPSVDDPIAQTPEDGPVLEHKKPQPLCQIATPIGMLGYGFEEDQLTKTLERLTSFSTPTAIVLDSGSTDGGPTKLATGIMTSPRSAYKCDLTKLLRAVLRFRVPLLISSAGGDGSNAHVDSIVDIIREIVQGFTEPLSKPLDILVVYADISKEVVFAKLEAGDITGCGPVVPPLTKEKIECSPTIVAQMGPEPLLQAMAAHPGFDILIAGRSYDPAPYVSYCAFQAMKIPQLMSFESLGSRLLGGFTHMGKIMECGGICATPKSRGAIATVYTDGSFDISPMDPKAICTPLSVAAHTLYEKTRPDLLYGPGGYLDLTTTTYQQLEDNISVRACGATFHFTRDEGAKYTVKLEGATVTGYRSIFIGSFIDPILIGQLRYFLNKGLTYIMQEHPQSAGNWKMDWHLNGLEENSENRQDNIMAVPVPKKVFIIGEVLADSQELATAVANTARIYCAHGSYPGQKATSGNFAMGIGGKLQLPMGECAEFSIYHLMWLNPGEEGAEPVTTTATGGDVIIGKKKTGDVLIHHPLFSWKRVVLERDTSRPAAAQEHTIEKVALSTLKIQQAREEIPSEKPEKRPEIGNTPPPKTLGDIAKVIRSKNAGPFEVTLDVMFDDISVYQSVKKSKLLSPETIVRLYGFSSVHDLVWCGFFDQALAFKATLPRTRRGEIVCSGGYMEDDVHGSQQYMPLMDLELTEELIRELVQLGWRE